MKINVRERKTINVREVKNISFRDVMTFAWVEIKSAGFTGEAIKIRKI